MKTIINNASELKSLVSNWVDTFNFVQLEVLEKMSDNCLFEYIKQPKLNFTDFLDNYDLWDEYNTYLQENEEEDTEETKEQFCEDQNSFDRWRDEQNNDNYPMWNTCFEFKHSENDEVIEAAEKAGFGIIEGLEPFETILFVHGAGYSFYGAHWIPLFLELPWNSDIKQQVIEKGIKYDNQ